MALAPGTKLGLYEIQSPLGAGGMGEVYRATDTKLGRDIALKVLPVEMAHDPERLARFRREAKALAQLDHPNIVTIHSVEESDGVHFLTMQLVEGQPLDRLIPPEGLPVEQIVEIASALGDALAAAHEKGIMHRDLKPANVMVSNEGRVKVLDFGLAKDVRAAGLGDATMTSASQTQVGVVMGTPAYMSPEQTSGRLLDHRTDIFSLGVVLHEMATGRRPFEGTSSAELVSAILRDTPPSVTDRRPDLPSDLARIIRRCLEKDPRHRVQTARDVSNEFRDLTRQISQNMARATTSKSRAAFVPDFGVARADEGFWVAVLPFKYSGGNADLTALAEGLTEDIVTGLSRFSYLRVIARSSTARYAGEAMDVRSAGKELGARYVMEGNLRQAGTKLRLAVQLVDANSGAHLWAETYLHSFDPEAIFELQDKLVPRIVATVADTRGVLPHTMSEALRSRPPEQLGPYEALLRSFAYFQRINKEEHAIVRAALERAVEQAPGNADAWAILSILYREEYTHEFNLLPDPLGRAFAAARRAIEIAPSNHYGYHALASVLFFRRELQAFHSAAQRAITLNSMDGFTVGYMGLLIAFAGDWEHGCALSERARSLNPHHPGWYWFAPLFDAYRKGDYRGALDVALKVNMPGFWRTQAALAATYGQLGELDLARSAGRELLGIRPDFPVVARAELGKWWEPELVERIIDGLRKAGVEITPEKGMSVPAIATTHSSAKHPWGASRAEEGFWVAVLPFKYAGGNAEIAALAEGLTEDVVTGLSRFSYLHVIARSSTSRFANQAVDVRSAGQELGARYVMEGSLRQAGTKLRLAIQLVDAVSGAHLWAENYERTFSPENIFALQDDLAPRIVSTVADQHGVLPHSMSHLIRNKSDEQLSPYEALLRVFGLHERMSPDEHASVRALLERTVQNAPGEGDCWAMLATLYCDEYMFGFPGEPDPLQRAQAAARRAIEIGPSNWLASQAVAQSLFFGKEWQAFRPLAERTIALNRMDGAACAFMGILLALSGEWERGCQVADAAMQLNPHHPGWYWLAAVFDAYRKQDYRASVDAALRINMPGYFWGPATSAAAFGQLGNSERARKAVTELLAIRPDFAERARPEFAKWFDEELSEHYVEGLRKAGLEITGTAGASVAVKAPDSGALRAVEGFWVAVLPFKSTGAELTSLAEGLSEEIVTGLSRFSYLRVIARGSTLKYASQTTDLRTVGKELGARYVMEGSLRQGGARLRVTVQLIDATTGTQMWAETYERAFGPEAIFEVQDDLVPRIVATVADHEGVLPQSMAEVLRNKSEDQLTPHEATLRSFRFFKSLDVEEHATAKRVLERAVRSAPNHGDCWAMLSHMYSNDYWHGPDSRSEDLDRALAAARRAVDVAPSNHLSYWALALALYLKRDIPAFRLAAERAIELNRMDGSSVAFMGSLIAISGDWERGCAIAEPASALNPNHAGWHRFLALYNAYNKGDYPAARAAALRLNIPENFQDPAARAAVFGQLGEPELGRKAVQELLALQPDFASMARTFYSKWLGPELVVRLIEGWRKAGLEIDGATSAASPSGATRAEEGFWVALLPLKYNGSNADLTALADGLTEDIVTGLSRFSYLRVIARSSTARYARESVDVRAAGKEVGARYVMEGSLRQAGTKLRLAVQLVDAVSGAHLWAENYERAFRPEALFELQDDLVPRIVSTVADMNGALPRSMSEAVRSRNPDQLSPYEAVLRSFGYLARVTPEDLAAARSGLELAVRKAPDYADAWAMLAFLCVQDYGQGFSLQADSLTSGLTAARRAVDAAPSNPLAYCSLAQGIFQKEFQSFRNAAERAVALNPMDGNFIAFLGELLTYAGDWERGLACRDAQAAQPQSSRLVLVCRLLQLVSAGLLPRGTLFRA